MPGAEYEALLRRRRIWGVPPDAVKRLAAETRREQAELRARIEELEGRLARATTERDEANQAAAASRERVARLEQENREIADRPEAIREEAVRFVVDAWAEAQALREQTRREIEAAETKAREEIAAIRRDFIAERRRYEAEMADERRRYEAEMTAERQRSEAEIAALRERRRTAIMELESLAQSLLSQAARVLAPRPSPAPPDNAAPVADGEAAATAGAAHRESPAPPVIATNATASGGTAEDRLLAKALNDLEAILNAPRKPNGG